jgi:signal peptidase II
MALIPPHAAIRSRRARWAAAAIVAVMVTADEVTKSLVLAGRISGSAGWASVRLVRNTGSAGGLVSGHPVLVTALALAVTAFAVTLVLRSRRPATALFFALVVAGGTGNLADRLFRAPGLGRGGVVDWIQLAGRNGSMNLSDLAINVGVIGAVIALVLTREPAAAKAPGPQPAEPGSL